MLAKKKVILIGKKNAEGSCSTAIKVNDHVYFSGLVCDNTDLEKSFEDQIIYLLDYLKYALEDIDLTINHIVKMTIYLTNIDQKHLLDNYLERYFDDPLPALTVLGCYSIEKNANILLDAHAIDTSDQDFELNPCLGCGDYCGVPQL